MKINPIISHSVGQEANRSCSETSLREFLLQEGMRPYIVNLSGVVEVFVEAVFQEDRRQV